MFPYTQIEVGCKMHLYIWIARDVRYTWIQEHAWIYWVEGGVVKCIYAYIWGPFRASLCLQIQQPSPSRVTFFKLPTPALQGLFQSSPIVTPR